MEVPLNGSTLKWNFSQFHDDCACVSDSKNPILKVRAKMNWFKFCTYTYLQGEHLCQAFELCDI